MRLDRARDGNDIREPRRNLADIQIRFCAHKNTINCACVCAIINMMAKLIFKNDSRHGVEQTASFIMCRVVQLQQHRRPAQFPVNHVADAVDSFDA